MDIRKGFYDLCVPYQKNTKELSRILTELYEYGYRTVAIEQEYDHTVVSKKTPNEIPRPVDLTALKLEFDGKLTLLSRLTIVYQDPIIVHAMNTSMNLKQFHLIAAAPKTEAALQHCCSTFSGDIVTRHASAAGGGGFKMIHVSHKFFTLALRRGLSFELKYAPAIVDSNQRKDMLTIGHQYASQRKSGNVLISSGATSKFHVRGPYDIANLGLIFGLSEEQSKSAISHVCRKTLLNAESRRLGKTVMYVKNIDGSKLKHKSLDSDDDESSGDNISDEESDFDDDETQQPSKKSKLSAGVK